MTEGVLKDIIRAEKINGLDNEQSISQCAELIKRVINATLESASLSATAKIQKAQHKGYMNPPTFIDNSGEEMEAVIDKESVLKWLIK